MNNSERVSSGLEGIAAQHRELEHRIRRLRRQIRAPVESANLLRSFCDARAELGELREFMEHHLAQEEAGGYLEEAVARVPRLAAEADAIEKQHPELRKEVVRLFEMTREPQLTQAAWKQFGAAVTEFAQKLLTHECTENRILREGFNEDPALFD